MLEGGEVAVKQQPLETRSPLLCGKTTCGWESLVKY